MPSWGGGPLALGALQGTVVGDPPEDEGNGIMRKRRWRIGSELDGATGTRFWVNPRSPGGYTAPPEPSQSLHHFPAAGLCGKA